MSRRHTVSKKTADPPRPSGAAGVTGVLDRSGASVVLLMAVALVTRLLAALNIPALTYDGVFYLRQAERILRGTYVFEGFPPGLPLPVALLGVTGMDLEFAARVLDLLAGVGSVGVFYALCRRHVGNRAAFLLSLVLAVHPVFVRVQVEVWSEPLYVLSLLGAFLLFERGRWTWCGVLLGYAFLLRPESLVLLGGLVVVQTVRRRRVPWGMLVAGVLPVLAFSILSSRELGSPVITAKQGQWDLSAAVWDRIGTLSKTLHGVFPLILVPFAVLEGVRRRSVLLLPVGILVGLPLYDIHIQQRIHLPAAVFLGLLSGMWLTRQQPPVRNGMIALSMAFLIWGTAGSARSFFRPGVMIEHSRDIGRGFASQVTFDDAVAARFPFIPWYSGSGFVRLENLAYEALMDSIRSAGATHLLVLENEVINIRPQLRDLFDNTTFVRSESRLRLVAREDRFPGERALLYALQPAPIPAGTAVASPSVLDAAWLDHDWIAVDSEGRLVCGAESAAAELIDSWRRSATGSPDAATLREIATFPADGRLALLHSDGSLSISPRTDRETTAGWTSAPRRSPQAHSLTWIDSRHLLMLDDDGNIVAVDSETGRSFRVIVAGIPQDLPARALATRPLQRDIAITYRRPTPERPLQRAIATVVWPETIADDLTVLELEVRWGALIQLHDDRVAWVPGRDLLMVSQAILQYENADYLGHVASLSLVQSDGQTRRLSFHEPQAVAPQMSSEGSGARGPGAQPSSRVGLLYQGSAGALYRTTLPTSVLEIPEVAVFTTPPQVRP